MAKKRSAAAERAATRRARLKAEKDAAKLAGGTGPAAATAAQAGADATGAASGTKAEKAAKSAKGDGPFKVRAIAPGYYDLVRRRDGDVFTIKNQQEFSSKWMVRVPASTPDKVTTGQEEINRQHDEVLSDKLKTKATGGANPLGAE